MASTNTRDVLLFTGQGSNQHLAEQASVDGLRELLGEEQRLAFDLFLHQCRDAFQSELHSTTTEEKSILGSEIHHALNKPGALLLPPQSFQSHPIFEALSLYNRQVLELMLFQSQKGSHHVVETAGICTGVIPAIIAASFLSYDSDDFVEAAIEGFRLAFWIGLRASLFCHHALGEFWKDIPCVLSVFGVSPEELEVKLASYTEQQRLEDSNYRLKVRISAIFNDGNISICGQGSSLAEIKSRLTQDSIQCRWANVHALYHRGTEMEDIVKATLSDAKRRGIKFSTWESLHVPLRSAMDGMHVSPKVASHSESLLETAIRGIFVDTVDWRITGTHIHALLSNNLDRDSAAKFRIIGFGPGSRSLVNFAKDLLLHPRLEVIENWTDSLAQPSVDDIGIVGLSVNYPEAKGQDHFWSVLENGRSAVSEIPSSRFDISQYCEGGGSPRSPSQRLSVKHGNFLQDPFDFDASYFNISPREAKSIDPQQRLLLHAAMDALEDAGYAPNTTPTFQTATFGVYMGVATGDYVDNLRNDMDVYYSPGTLRSFLSGRISYAFKFKGPSMAIDTACSSSLVALYHACMALRSGECTAALAGGVNTITSPDMYCGLSRAHFLSPTGQCKPFDKSADGYCRSEGCGVVVLKKLSQAIQEGDHIYGVIRGIGVNQCGTAKSITHPDTETQATLMKNVLKSSRASPGSINVVEAHGTGTQAGDYAEVSSIRSVFGSRSSENPLYVSSVKGNIGHSEAASGIAGLAKLLLMMEKKRIPPQASYNKLNPRLEKLVDGSMIIPTQLEQWKKGSGQSPRRGLLNNFGASGSNAALVVEENIRPVTRVRNTQLNSLLQSRSHHVLNLSAKTEQALDKLRLSYISYISKDPHICVDDFCYTANSRRQLHFPYKSSIIASSTDELLERLRQPIDSGKILQPDRKQKTVFVFSGQGSIHMGMGAELLSTVQQFRDIVDKCDTILSENGFAPVKPFLENSSPASSSQGKEEEIVISQCACFVLEYALASVWIQWGVIPDVVIGHSIGEYAAFAIARALNLKDALLFLARRAQLMASKCTSHSTGMITCRLLVTDIDMLLTNESDEFAGMTIACINSPQDFVLAGPLASLANFAQHCKDKGTRHKILDVPLGFHSPAVDPILEDLVVFTPTLKIRPSSIRMGSSLYGRLLGNDEMLEPEYFVKHAREPVSFSSLAEDIVRWSADSSLTILEIGPSPSTESMFKQTMDKTYTFLSSLHPLQGAWTTLTTALQTLFLQNYRIQWRSVYDGSRAKFLRSLPRYPLTTSSHFIPFKEPQPLNELSGWRDDGRKQPRYAFLPLSNTPATNASSRTFITHMKQISQFVKAHNVGGVALCPASVYLEMVLQALAQQDISDPESNICVFENTTFDHPLVYIDGGDSTNEQNVQTELDIRSAETVHFSSTSSTNQILCAGRVRSLGKTTQTVADILNRKQAQSEKLKQTFRRRPGESIETFSSRTIYRIIFPRVVEYGDPFLALEQLTLNTPGLEGYGTFRLAPLVPETDGRFVSSPVFIDTLLHSAGFIANTSVDPDIACICVSLEQAMVPGDSPELHEQDLKIYCTLIDIAHSFIADAYALDANDKMLGYVEGMYFKKLKLKSFKAHLSREATHFTKKTTSPIPRTSEPLPPGKKTLLDTSFRDVVSQGRASITSTIHSVIRELCGTSSDLTVGTLTEMGVDSLLLIELTGTLIKRFPHVNILQPELENCKTVGDIVDVIIEASDQQGDSSSETPSLLLTTGPSSVTSISGLEMHSGQSQPTQTLVSNSEPLIKSLFADVCGLEPSGEEKNRALSSLGVDSLMSIELFQKLRETLSINIDEGHENISELTYRQLEELCAVKSVKSLTMENPSSYGDIPHDTSAFNESHEDTSAIDTTDRVEDFPKLLQRRTSQGSNSNLYLFHDGSGLCGMYSRLASIDRNVYGIFNLDSLSSAKPEIQTMEDLAAMYIERANLVSKSEIILGGWSFGGVLAFEVSRQLLRLGKVIKGIILIDSPVPVDHKALPQEIIASILSRGSSVRSDAARKARDGIGTNFKRYAAMLQNYNPSAGQIDVPCVMLGCLGTIDTERLCGVSYPWLNNTAARKNSIEKWEHLIGMRIPVLELDCDHFGVFESANIGNVSRKLQMACELLDAQEGTSDHGFRRDRQDSWVNL